MEVTAGKTVYQSSFESDGWHLNDGNELLVIPYDKIYNYHSYKIHKKTDLFTVGIVILGGMMLTPWIWLLFAIPVAYYVFYATRLRLDTESGDIVLKFISEDDKNEFLGLCKKRIPKQRWRSFKQGWFDTSRNTFLDKLVDKVMK